MENLESTRKFDKSTDKEMTEYTKETLFPYLNEQFIFAEANYDKSTQIKGVDYVFITERGIPVNVDEKSQLHYLNKNSNTYSLEIGMLKGRTGEERTRIDGWFVSEDNITDLYLFVYPNAEGKTYKDVKKEDFDKVEYLLVPKQSIKEYLSNRMLTTEKVFKLEEISRAIANKVEIEESQENPDFSALKEKLEADFPGLKIHDIRGTYDRLSNELPFKIKGEFEGASISKTEQRAVRCELNGVRMVLSLEGRNGDPMPEKPFNIILDRDIYEELAILKLETNHGKIIDAVDKLDDYEKLTLPENCKYDKMSVEEISKLKYRDIHCLEFVIKDEKEQLVADGKDADLDANKSNLRRNFESALTKNGRMILSVDNPDETELRCALGSYSKLAFKKEGGVSLEKLLETAEKRIDFLIENGLNGKFPMIPDKQGARLKEKLEDEVAKFAEKVEQPVEQINGQDDKKVDKVEDDDDGGSDDAE